MPNRIFTALLFVSCFMVFIPEKTYAAKKPLLMEGKQTLYQRILTTPHAQLVETVGSASGEEIATFSVYYIYEKKEKSGAAWLKVGTSTNGTIAGWMKEDFTVPWKQQIVLTFSNPAGRERSLLFSSQQTLGDILKNTAPEAIIKPLREKVIKKEHAENVISIEPENYINFQDADNFYLLPILDYKEHMIGDTPVNILEIASVTKEAEEARDTSTANNASDDTPTRQINGFNAAIVFVIDTTISMGPYIDRTQDLVKNVYDQIGNTELADKIKFGLVAYRSNIEKVPELEYASKLYVDPNDVASSDDFLKRVKDLKPATVSTPSFNEDAYAGIMTALNDIDWNTFGGRYIVLVTDAGAIEGDNTLSSTKLGSGNIRQEAKEKGVALYTMHLKTAAGQSNHYSAQSQYEDVSSNPFTDALYYSIKAGDVEEYAKTVSSLTEAMTTQINLAFEGEQTAGSAITATDSNTPDAPAQTSSDRIRRDAFLIGKAMRLAYLGRVENTKAPSFFKAWISDSDLSNPEKNTVDYRVLMTKKQLNDLNLVLSELLNKFEEGQNNEGSMSSADFFDSLRSVSAKIGRDPSQISDSTLTQLGEADLFDEYLQDLPYWSELMEISFENWETRGVMEKDNILNSIRRKLRHYKLINEDSDRWVILTEGAPASEAVYPIPLELMP